MSDELRTVYEDWSNGTVQPTARIRERIYWDAPTVTEFCIQLEYNNGLHKEGISAEWVPVARFDHNVSPTRGHDIREEGLHMDLFPGSVEERRVEGFPDVSLIQAPVWCRDYLEAEHQHYLMRLEKIGNIPPEDCFYG